MLTKAISFLHKTNNRQKLCYGKLKIDCFQFKLFSFFNIVHVIFQNQTDITDKFFIKFETGRLHDNTNRNIIIPGLNC